MALSAISSSSQVLASLSAASASASTSSSSSSNTTQSRLSALVDEAIASGDGGAVDLYRSLVTLTSASASTDTSSEASTYTAQGLLSTVTRSLALDNPLFGSDSADGSSLFSTADSLDSGDSTSTLSALYGALQSSDES